MFQKVQFHNLQQTVYFLDALAVHSILLSAFHTIYGYFGCLRIHFASKILKSTGIMGQSSTNCVFFGCILPMPLSALLIVYGHFGCSRILYEQLF